MGNSSSSTIDVNTKVANEVLAKINQKGSKITVNQENIMEGSEINLDGSQCPDGKIT